MMAVSQPSTTKTPVRQKRLHEATPMSAPQHPRDSIRRKPDHTRPLNATTNTNKPASKMDLPSETRRFSVSKKAKHEGQHHNQQKLDYEDDVENHHELSLLGEGDTHQEDIHDATHHEKAEAELRAQVEHLKAQMKGKDEEIDALKQSVKNASTKIAMFDRQKKKLLTSTAEQLHQQYSQKHVSKVQALKKSYERRYQDHIHELETRNDELNRGMSGLHRDVNNLTQQVEQLQNVVEQERQEKAELVEAYDQYLELQNDV